MNKVSKIGFIAFLGLVVLIACTKDKAQPTANVGLTSDCPDTIRYSIEIQNLINESCISCHGANGFSPNMTTHSSVAAHATAILSSIGPNGNMPQGAVGSIPDSVVQKVSCWITQGKLNN
jgi:hypothetical protein